MYKHINYVEEERSLNLNPEDVQVFYLSLNIFYIFSQLLNFMKTKVKDFLEQRK